VFTGAIAGAAILVQFFLRLETRFWIAVAVICATILLVIRLMLRRKLPAGNLIGIVMLISLTFLLPRLASVIYAQRKPTMPPGPTTTIVDPNQKATFWGRIAARRHISIEQGEPGGSYIDAGVEFRSPGDIVRYLPRAAEIGFFAPFPSMWFVPGTEVGRAGRLFSGGETALLYVIELLAFIGLWQNRKLLAGWLLILACSCGMIGLGLLVVNVGTLYRMRYAFSVLLVVMASAALVSRARPQLRGNAIRDAIRKFSDHIRLQRLKKTNASAARVVDQITKEGLTYLDIGALCDLVEVVLANERYGIEGTIVEAGCARGGSALAIASAKAANRPFFVYDVFGMIPAPSKKDGIDVHERYRAIASGQAAGIGGNPYYGYENDLYKKVAQSFVDYGFDLNASNIHLVKGLYRDTMKIDSPVALAHIDCDWYESVRVCLDQVVPNLVRGGTIIVDDYYVWSGCRKAVDEYFQEKRASGYRFVRKTRLHIVRDRER
jgi:asparagine synthase (glutamine-hydrolysing)